MKACEVPLPVGKVPNSIYDEAPNRCHSVSASLGRGENSLFTSGNCQFCMQILGCSFFFLQV